MSVTQQDIADHLGLSKMSVVRALSGQTKVSEATRHRVQEAARELGYDQNSNPEARLLIARRYGNHIRHGVIGFRSPDLENQVLPYYVHLLEGVRRGARTGGVELMFLDEPGTPAWSKVDGFIGYGDLAYLPPDYAFYTMPRVSIGLAVEGIPSVLSDDFAGAKAATEYLIGLGHRRIAYLIDLHVQQFLSVRRVNGYRAALHTAGIEAEERWVGPLHLDAAPFLTRGRDSMNRWLAGDWKELGCTALLVQNDRAAMGALEALQDTGIRVPEDVSVIGFDSTDECELTRPTLTSVHVPLEEMGARAVDLLVRQIKGEEAAPPNEVLPVKLEVRNSTAPPKT